MIPRRPPARLTILINKSSITPRRYATPTSQMSGNSALAWETTPCPTIPVPPFGRGMQHSIYIYSSATTDPNINSNTIALPRSSNATATTRSSSIVMARGIMRRFIEVIQAWSGRRCFSNYSAALNASAIAGCPRSLG